MRYLLAALAALLPACAAKPTPPESNNVAIVWNRVEEPHRVCESLAGRKNLFPILGCSQWSPPATPGGPRICSIYAPEPKSERDLQRFATLGHELMHCFDGNWHDQWGRMHTPALASKKLPQSAGAGASTATP